jgi:hypothetical protein
MSMQVGTVMSAVVVVVADRGFFLIPSLSLVRQGQEKT